MPRLTLLRRTFAIPDDQDHLLDERWVDLLLNEGRFDNDILGRFTGGCGGVPEEIAPFFEVHGLKSLALVSAEGIAAGNGSGIALRIAECREIVPEKFEVMIDLVVTAAGDPSILGMAAHLLYVGEKT